MVSQSFVVHQKLNVHLNAQNILRILCLKFTMISWVENLQHAFKNKQMNNFNVKFNITFIIKTTGN